MLHVHLIPDMFTFSLVVNIYLYLEHFLLSKTIPYCASLFCGLFRHSLNKIYFFKLFYLKCVESSVIKHLFQIVKYMFELEMFVVQCHNKMLFYFLDYCILIFIHCTLLVVAPPGSTTIQGPIEKTKYKSQHFQKED